MNERALVRAAWRRARTELLQFRRGREVVFFTLAFPVLMLLLFGTIFRNQEISAGQSSVSFPQYFVAGIIGSAIWWTAFQNNAVLIPVERDSGGLKRLAGTPIPRSAYFIGKILLTVLVTLLECAVLVVLGVLLYHVHVPGTAQWLTFAWVLLLGVASCALLGVAVAGLVPRGRSAAAVIAPFAIVMQFLSGVYYVYGDLPSYLQTVGAIFPLKWLTQAMRSVLLPDGFHRVEPQHAWQLGQVALVLLAWCVASLVVALLTFRWTPARER